MLDYDEIDALVMDQLRSETIRRLRKNQRETDDCAGPLDAFHELANTSEFLTMWEINAMEDPVRWPLKYISRRMLRRNYLEYCAINELRPLSVRNLETEIGQFVIRQRPWVGNARPTVYAIADQRERLAA